ncbi:MAG: polysaccharide pyruvyl transferase family protein [Mycobacteriaceae bacterium]
MDNALNILVVNAWHDDNKGDSAITAGIIRLLTLAAPQSSITIVGLVEDGILASTALRHIKQISPELRVLSNPMPTELRTGSHSHPLVDVPVWLIRLLPSYLRFRLGSSKSRFDRLLRSSDLVVAVGGSNLYSDESVSAIVSSTRFFTLATPVYAALQTELPVLLLGHTLGPFPAKRKKTLRLAQKMLGKVNLAVLRDKASLKTAEILGIESVEVAPDMAYATVPLKTKKVSEVLSGFTVEPHRMAVVAIRKHPSLSNESNLRLVEQVRIALVEMLNCDDIDGVIVIAHTLGPTKIEDDRDISLELFSQLRDITPRSEVYYLEEDLSAAELSWLYGQCACMIAVRLHAAILAMLLGTPILAISYFSHKTVGVMQDVGLGDYVYDFDSVTASNIIESIAEQRSSEKSREVLAELCTNKRELLERSASRWLELALGSTAETPG